MNAKMTPELFEIYSANPVGLDPVVRHVLKLPEDRYYTVSVWPPDLAGNVFVDSKRVRTVKNKKVSKSDQAP